MLVPALIAGSLYTGALQRRAESLQIEKLTSRGELGASLFARRLYQLWLEVETFSRSVDIDDLGKVRRDIDFIGGLDRRYSWIGVTDVQGRVLASLGGMLEGESVAQRPWFRRGLTGPAAIDVHEAQLLAKLLPASSEPYRFIDFAVPLRRGNASPNGVLGAHLDWRWVRENLADMIVSVATARTPRVSIVARASASAASTMNVSMTSAYIRATPTALDSRPRYSRKRSAGPLSATPPMMPLIAATGVPRDRASASASRIPGRARIGPIETIGLDGAMTIASAASIASRTSTVARALSMPRKRTSSTSGA